VVRPLQFPGGNIGDLAVYGTVNDLAVSGAEPLWLSLALIVEEGLPLATLRMVLDAVKAAADRCGVQIATGDTKVVPRGQCDGLYVNTAGIGRRLDGFDTSPDRIHAGDVVIVSGTLGDHGMAVLACRENIEIENGPVSDSGPVHRLVKAAQPWGAGVRFMRDPTRGGLAAVLNEIVEGRWVGIQIDETALPFSTGTRAVAEMLGMDLLNVASEGRVLAVCDPAVAEPVLDAWRGLGEGQGSCAVGTVTGRSGHVSLRTVIGGSRLVHLPHGELLPRIC
jgi:hydrogenase expression/formation protein HypE